LLEWWDGGGLRGRAELCFFSYEKDLRLLEQGDQMIFFQIQIFDLGFRA
jgi:hypothetical protein